MPAYTRSLLVALIATCGVAAGNVAVRADSTIKVLVNDQPITSYDVAQRVSLMALANEKGGAKVALDQLIDEAVEMSEAKKRNFVAPRFARRGGLRFDRRKHEDDAGAR